MSRKHNIDRIFSKISQKHEERYDSRDWDKMHALLLKEGLCKSENSQSLITKILYKLFYAGTLLLILFTPSHLQQDDFQYLQKLPEQSNTTLSEQNNSLKLSNHQEKVEKTSQPSNDLKQNIDLNDTQNQYAQRDQKISQSTFDIIAQPLRQKQENSSTKTKLSKQLAKPIYKTYLPKKQLLKYDASKNLINYLNEASQTLLNSDTHVNYQKSILDSAPLASQLAEPEDNKFQIGIFSPLSNVGKNSLEKKNKVSLNLLVGTSAELNGFELSGLGNIEKGKVKGLQIAGLFNQTSDSLEGVQVSGLVNLSGGQKLGIQLSGLMNISGKKEDMSETYEPTIADNKKFKSQISGIGNIDYIGSKNIQLGGVFNVAPQIKGVQLGGIANVAQDVRGVQIGGLVNVARRVKGVQIGLINIVEDLNGASIGLINVVKKNAYRKLEFWGTESFHTNIGFKLGTRKFYNIFVLGSQISPGTFRWGLGYGFGSQVAIGQRNHVSMDLIAYHVNEERKLTKKLNLLTQFKVSIAREFGNGIAIFGGPTLNLLTSDFKNSDNSIGSQIAPWTFYQNVTKGRGTKIKIWGGLNFGVSF